VRRIGGGRLRHAPFSPTDRSRRPRIAARDVPIASREDYREDVTVARSNRTATDGSAQPESNGSRSRVAADAQAYMNDVDINYTKEAFLNPINLAFLIVAMLTAFFLSGSEPVFNLILIMAAALELMYLGVVPRNERFRRAIRSQRAAEHAKPPSQKEIFQLLTKTSHRRHARLRKLEKDISPNYPKLSSATQGLLESHLQKIAGLLDSYLNLLYQKERYEYTIRAGTEGEVLQAIASLREDMADDTER